MFVFLKKFFYKEECNNSKTLIDKIKCIKKNLIVTPYSKEYKSLNMSFINKNIVEAIHDLEYLINSIKIDNIEIRRICNSSINDLYFNKWFTDNEQNILNNSNEIWYKYIDLNIWLIEWYNLNNKAGSKYYSYTIKIRPYIINIDTIVDSMIEHQNKSL